MTAAMTGARCALHTDRDAQGICKRCGNFACAECNRAGFDSGTLCVQCAETSAESRYHVVPPGRFLLVCVLSFNLYFVYWFWKNWSTIKRRDGSDIWPIARAIFCGITFFELISDINTQLALRGSQRRLSGWLGVGPIVFSAAHRLPGAFSLLSLVSAGFVLPAVLAIRELASTAALENARWRLRHTLLVIVGAIFLALMLFGTFLPENPA